MKRWQRRRLFVDSEVQGALLLRATLYWITSIVTVALLIFVWQVIRSVIGSAAPEDNDLWSYALPVGLSALFLLPIFAYDLIKLSNMLVGPILRLRQSLRQLNAGEHVLPIKFRNGDFWQSFAGEFNEVAKRIERLEQERDQALAALEQAEVALRAAEESPSTVSC